MNKVVEYVITRSNTDKKLYNVLGLDTKSEVSEVVDLDMEFDDAVALCEEKNTIFPAANSDSFTETEVDEFELDYA